MRDRSHTKRAARRVAAAVAVTTVLSAGAATAHAKYNVPDPCGVRDDAQVFQRWGDRNYYFLMPNGGMENGLTGWVGPSFALPSGGTFRNDDSVVVGRNETFGLRGSGGTNSLRVSTKSGRGTNVSRTICVKRNEGTVRFAYRPGPVGTKLQVAVVQQERGSFARAPQIARRTYTIDGTGSGAWAISPIFETGAVYSGGDSADIYLEFRATGGEWLVDGVYVDPIRIR